MEVRKKVGSEKKLEVKRKVGIEKISWKLKKS